MAAVTQAGAKIALNWWLFFLSKLPCAVPSGTHRRRELFLAVPCPFPCVGGNGAAEQQGRLFLSAWEISETG